MLPYLSVVIVLVIIIVVIVVIEVIVILVFHEIAEETAGERAKELPSVPVVAAFHIILTHTGHQFDGAETVLVGVVGVGLLYRERGVGITLNK